MGSLRLVAIALLLASPAFAQTYGVGRPPTPEEIRALDISISPTGEELPPGKGTAKEGGELYRTKGCVACHGAAGVGGIAPLFKSKNPSQPEVLAKERILPPRAPHTTIEWYFI